MIKSVEITKEAEAATTQLKLLVTASDKHEWQVRCKLEGVTVSAKIRELMTLWISGEGMGEEAAERLRVAKAAKRKQLAILVNDAIAWPVGLVHEVFEDCIEEGVYPALTAYVDDAGFLFDDTMTLLTGRGEPDARAGGGSLAWELTWGSAVNAGWRPSEEALRDYTVKQRWEHVKHKMLNVISTDKLDIRKP